MAELVLYKGACHCQAVKISVLAPKDVELCECNCSMCYMKGVVPSSLPQRPLFLSRSSYTHPHQALLASRYLPEISRLSKAKRICPSIDSTLAQPSTGSVRPAVFVRSTCLEVIRMGIVSTGGACQRTPSDRIRSCHAMDRIGKQITQGTRR